MGKIWSVDVSIDGENILTIGSDWLSGKSSLTIEDEKIIEGAAESLLSFLGKPINKVNSTDACCCSDDNKGNCQRYLFGQGNCISERH